jgi:hypothetical protein
MLLRLQMLIHTSRVTSTIHLNDSVPNSQLLARISGIPSSYQALGIDGGYHQGSAVEQQTK